MIFHIYTLLYIGHIVPIPNIICSLIGKVFAHNIGMEMHPAPEAWDCLRMSPLLVYTF